MIQSCAGTASRFRVDVWRAWTAMASRIRAMISIAIAGVLLSASMALADGRRYVGTVKPAGRVTVTTTVLNGRRVVKRFLAQGVPYRCADYTSLSIPRQGFDTAQGLFGDSGAPFPTIFVSYRRFEIRFLADARGASVFVKGSFNANFSRATGTIRFKGGYYPAGDCDSGKDTWTAK